MVHRRSSLRFAGAVAFTAGAFLAIGATPIAGAEPVLPTAGAESAADTVRDLQAAGFTVQLNYIGGGSEPNLARCRVSDIHNPVGAMASLVTLSTVYVDVTCGKTND